MPKIRDWTFGYQATATNATVTAALPSYVAGDLLIAILSSDTGAQTWSSAGWTQLFTVTNTSNLGILWKIAGASEATPTFSYTVAETSNVHILSIQDVNTSAPFNGTGGAGTGYRTANNSAARVAMPTLTTTVANSLILYINSESGAVVPSVLQGACTFEDAADGSAHSDGFSWGFMKTAGNTPTVYGSKNGVSAGVIATIGISPPATGANVIPAYCANDLSIYVDPIHGVTAYNGNTAFAATATTNFGTSINGRTLSNGTVAAAADVGINSFHSMGKLTGLTTNGTYAGAALVLATGNKPDVSGKNVLVHVKPTTPKSYQTTDPITKSTSKGLVFAMASTPATAFKAWHVHGAGTPWDSAGHIPLVINDQATLGLIQSTGTLNPASIASFGFFESGFTLAPAFEFGSLWVLDVTTVAGGNASEPVGVNGLWKVCAAGKERMSVLQQGAGQALILQPIQFGNGGLDNIYLDLGETAIEFPQQYNVASKNVFYCSADNVAGLTYYAGAGDTIIHNNAVVSSKSKFHWRIHPSSDPTATYNFSGLSIIGAGDVQLRALIPFDNMSFTSCLSIWQNGSELTNCNFTGSKLFSNNLENISGCNFLFTGTGNAIEITTAGTFNFINNNFIGYGANETVDSAIYNSVGSSVEETYDVGGSTTPIYSGVDTSVGQVITGTGKKIYSFSPYIKSIGVPSGNIRAVIYATTGSLPTTIPTGAALAYSDWKVASSVPTTAGYVPFYFTPFKLESGVNYAIVIESDSIEGWSISNNITFNVDATTASHYGVLVRKLNTGMWSAGTGSIDLRFNYTAYGEVTVNITGGGSLISVINSAGSHTIVNNTVSLTISANVSLLGSEIRIYDLDNNPTGSLGTELSGIESNPSTTYVYGGSGGNLIYLQIMKNGYEEFGTQITMPTTDSEYSVTLQPENNL